MVCLECGNNFFKQRRHQTYCGKKCRNRANSRKSYKPKALQKQSCQVCHNTFNAKHTRSTCSKQCRIKLDGMKRREAGKLRKSNMDAKQYARRRAKAREYFSNQRAQGKDKVTWACVTCGNTFKVKRHCQAGYWCSQRCQVSYWSKGIQPSSSKEIVIKKNNQPAYKVSTIKGGWWVAGNCVVCSTPYISPHLDKTCSPRCKRKNQRKGRDWIAPALRLAIYERDAWSCWICKEKVERDIEYSYEEYNPLYPSLDHVIPRSKGGSNHPDNLKLAHVQCNALRGAPNLVPLGVKTF